VAQKARVACWEAIPRTSAPTAKSAYRKPNTRFLKTSSIQAWFLRGILDEEGIQV
jgi:hypothetical protein